MTTLFTQPVLLTAFNSLWIFWLKTREHIELFLEENGAITVEMGLQHYLPLFLRKNGR